MSDKCPVKMTNKFINSMKPTSRISKVLFPCFDFHDDGNDKVAITINMEKLRAVKFGSDKDYSIAASLMKELENVNVFNTFWVIDDFIGTGPKLILPTADEFRAMANVEINIPVTEYRQPFETFGIVIPKEIGSPYSLIMGRVKEFSKFKYFSICTDYTPDAQDLYTCVPLMDDGKTIDNIIGKCLDDSFGCLDIIDRNLLLKYQRVFMNFCMLMTNNPIQRQGTLNPLHEASLLQTISSKKVPEAVRKSAEDELRSLPVIYGFDQSVRIYETEDGPHETTGTGSPVKPHWRRGHWRHQPHGKEMGLRKLIFIPAVLVNSHRFAGDLSNTRASYHTARKSESNQSAV